MTMARSLASALVFLGLSTGAALAAPVPQQQERSFVIQFAPVPYTSQPQAAPNGAVVATTVGFRFRGLTPRGGYTVVSLGDVTGDGVPDAWPVCNFVADNAGSGSCTTQLGPGHQLSSRIELRAGAANGNAILRTF
jgi:hypothetical protein